MTPGRNLKAKDKNPSTEERVIGSEWWEWCPCRFCYLTWNVSPLWSTYYSHNPQHLPLYLCFDPCFSSRHANTKHPVGCRTTVSRLNSVRKDSLYCSSSLSTYSLWCNIVLPCWLSIALNQPTNQSRVTGMSDKTEQLLILRQTIITQDKIDKQISEWKWTSFFLSSFFAGCSKK